MTDLSDITTWRDVFVQALTELGRSLAGFAPQLVGALLILAVGWLLAHLVALGASRGLRGLGLDRMAARVQLTDVLERAGMNRTPSELVGRLVFWLLLLTFLLSSIETLGLDAVKSTIDDLVAYIPRLLAAGLIGLLGLLGARFVGGLTSSAAAAAGFDAAPRLGFLAHALVSTLVVVVAVEQLGVGTAVLVGPLTVVLGTAGLAVGLSFALGAYPIVTHILAGHFLKQSLPRDVFVEVDGERGVVERIGATDTVLRNGERSWSVPNALLLNRVVVR